MSSYLTFYLVPKIKDSEPLTLCSYSRNSNIYKSFNETLNVTFIGMNEPQYTELTVDKVDKVIASMREEIASNKKRVIEYEKHAAGNTDIIEYILELKEDIEILEWSLNKVEFIKDLIEDISIGYTDFTKVLCNVD